MQQPGLCPLQIAGWKCLKVLRTTLFTCNASGQRSKPSAALQISFVTFLTSDLAWLLVADLPGPLSFTPAWALKGFKCCRQTKQTPLSHLESQSRKVSRLLSDSFRFSSCCCQPGYMDNSGWRLSRDLSGPLLLPGLTALL